MSPSGGNGLIGDSAECAFRPRPSRIGSDNQQLFINRINKAVARTRTASSSIVGVTDASGGGHEINTYDAYGKPAS